MNGYSGIRRTVGLVFVLSVLSFIGPGLSLGGSEIDVVSDVKNIESTGDNIVVTRDG